MKSHFGPVFVVVIWAVMACYIGYSFFTGSLRIRGKQEPILRTVKPVEYRYNMTIITVIFVILTAIFAWMFL
jgi:hypothetical protein